MDQKTQEVFDEILALDKDQLTEEQRQFLMARRSYLNEMQRKHYADLIEAHEAAAEEAAGEAEAKPKRGKKSE